jgi:hypothetical protein
MDVVVIASCFDRGFAASVLLGDLAEVRVVDANLSVDLTVLVHYSDLSVLLVDIYSKVHLPSLRDDGA